MSTKEKVIKLRKQGLTIPQICEKLNLGKGTVGFHLKGNLKVKRKHSEETKQKISKSSKGKPKKSFENYLNKINLTKEEFIELSLNSISRTDLCKKLKLHYLCVVKLQKYFNCEKICNKQDRIKLVKQTVFKRSNDYSKVLSGEETTLRNSYHNNHRGSLKRYLFKNNIKEYKCEECGITDWNKKPISLELEHMDGNNGNNKLENLKILCPNCHSQTSTWKGKNKKKLDSNGSAL